MSIIKRRREIGFFEDRLNFTLGPVELNGMMTKKEKMLIFDVRSEDDYRKGHIPGAISLPEEKWDTFKGMDKTGTNVFYCYTQQCHLATRACLAFAKKNYSVMELEGGWAAWKDYGYKVETAESMRRAA